MYVLFSLRIDLLPPESCAQVALDGRAPFRRNIKMKTWKKRDAKPKSTTKKGFFLRSRGMRLTMAFRIIGWSKNQCLFVYVAVFSLATGLQVPILEGSNFLTKLLLVQIVVPVAL